MDRYGYYGPLILGFMDSPADLPVDELFKVANALNDYTAGGISAIIGVKDEDYGELVGSGTFIKDGDTIFLVTAGHVAEKAWEYKCPTYSPGNGGPPCVFDKPFAVLGKPSDLAAVEIPFEKIQGSRMPFNISVLADSSQNLEGEILFVHGFAQDDSRFSAMAKAVYSKSLPYATFLGKSSVPEFNPSLHFAIEFKPEPQQNALGKIVELPKPYGLSGAAVWKAGRTNSNRDWNPSEARIVGIIHKWDQHACSLIATRVEALKYHLECMKRGGL